MKTQFAKGLRKAINAKIQASASQDITVKMSVLFREELDSPVKRTNSV